MNMVPLLLQIIGWSCFFGIAHSYVLYPVLLRWLARGKAAHGSVFEEKEMWPRVSVLMAAHNEEKVLHQKLESIQASQFPKDRLCVYLGSDGSTDQTHSIAAAFAAQHPWMRFFPFEQRQGKPGVINALAERALADWGSGAQHVFVITDANVFFSETMLHKLVRHFKDPRIAVVDSHILPLGLREEGISRAENRYLSLEVQIKHWEGQVWGAMIGPFGGCYAIRSDYFSQVPARFLVDDFYIVLKALEQGGCAINDLEAVCYEGATHVMQTEFRRKQRIGAGNFQNMQAFRSLWRAPWRSGLHFAFFSHKILRWITPHLLLIGLTALGLLAGLGNQFYQGLLLLAGIGMIGIPIFDLFLKQMGIQILPLRGIRYFIWMNAALFMGWIRYIKGIQTNVWQPTQRNE